MVLETSTASIISALIGAATTGITAYFAFKQITVKHKAEILKAKAEIEKERRIFTHEEKKISFFNEIMVLPTYSAIKAGVDEIFEKTKADRFLILIAINGKDSFNTVSVVMELHSERQRDSAIGKYHNIKIDDHYKSMLREAERRPAVNLIVDDMPNNSLLKTFYDMEGVKYSKIMFLARRALDTDNDMLVYCSIATHDEPNFTRQEKVIIQTIVQSKVITNIKKILEG